LGCQGAKGEAVCNILALHKRKKGIGGKSKGVVGVHKRDEIEKNREEHINL